MGFAGYGATEAQVKELMTIFSIMRPHDSQMERKFAETYIAPLKPDVDDYGNMFVRVGKDDYPIAWSSHVDTVHSQGGLAPIMLKDDGTIVVHPKSRANCLGADDGSGVWLMLQMIRAQKPGLYIFHRAEERGGKGSDYVARKTPNRLKGIQAAIAFDRKDNHSIITHQWGGRCCSEDFANSLATAIGLPLKSDSSGSFTDTANYVDLVGECTNLSVGYKGQHGRGEEQDLPFLLSLLDRMLEFDAASLVYKRKPGEKEKRKYRQTIWAGGEHGWHCNYYGDEGSAWDTPKLRFEVGKVWDQKLQGYVWPDSAGKEWSESKQAWVTKESVAKKGARTYMDTQKKWEVYRVLEDGGLMAESYLRLVLDYPEQIAKLLEDKQYGMGYLHSQITRHGCKVQTRYVEKGGAEVGTGVCKDCMRMKAFCQCAQIN